MKVRISGIVTRLLKLEHIPYLACLHCTDNWAYGTVQKCIFNTTTNTSMFKSRVLRNLKYSVPYQYRLNILQLLQCITMYAKSFWKPQYCCRIVSINFGTLLIA
jgi:hypothetical protein